MSYCKQRSAAGSVYSGWHGLISSVWFLPSHKETPIPTHSQKSPQSALLFQPIQQVAVFSQRIVPNIGAALIQRGILCSLSKFYSQVRQSSALRMPEVESWRSFLMFFLSCELLVAVIYHLIHDLVEHRVRVGRGILLIGQSAGLILVMEGIDFVEFLLEVAPDIGSRRGQLSQIQTSIWPFGARLHIAGLRECLFLP
ncbi:hypothetical protein FGO68_gene9353 [Halteria grandinella]|uniref:Uncharacterized protein n=1 Tax=Halteria grandinella TaxID=5974 RepID=A0A8J8P1L6_HALGN|nr:hypothetical protein FGO68_gene9353 [Halteria grandinella]